MCMWLPIARLWIHIHPKIANIAKIARCMPSTGSIHLEAETERQQCRQNCSIQPYCCHSFLVLVFTIALFFMLTSLLLSILKCVREIWTGMTLLIPQGKKNPEDLLYLQQGEGRRTPPPCFILSRCYEVVEPACSEWPLPSSVCVYPPHSRESIRET